MWEQYSAWSPYQYSLNNPVSLADLNGKEFRLIGNNSEQNQIYFNKAMNYFIDNLPSNASAKLISMRDSHIRLDINIRNDHVDKLRLSRTNQYIEWAPLTGLLFDDGGGQSPAMGLYHEIMHFEPIFDAFEKLPQSTMENWYENGIIDDLNMKEQMDQIIMDWFKLYNKPNEDYDNDEEKRVISGSEKAAADNIESESSRNDHNGTPTKVSSPTEVPTANENQ